MQPSNVPLYITHRHVQLSTWNDFFCWHFTKLNVSIPCCPLQQKGKPQKELLAWHTHTHTHISQLMCRDNAPCSWHTLNMGLFTIKQNPLHENWTVCLRYHCTICRLMIQQNTWACVRKCAQLGMKLCMQQRQHQYWMI